jgi:hypothetical protein
MIIVLFYVETLATIILDLMVVKAPAFCGHKKSHNRGFFLKHKAPD